jgi:Ca2+-binding EF-hand superfamily protein
MNMSISGIGGAATLHAVSGASTSMSPQAKMSDLYTNIDTGGAGAITQSQFNQAFQTMNPPAAFKSAGASAVWNSLDPNGTGQVSRQDFVSQMKNLMVQLRQGGTGASAASQTSITGTQALNNLA